MLSSHRRSRRISQQGFGLVDVLVGTALLGVAFVVMVGSVSSVLMGTQVAEQRTVEERLARNEIETLMKQPYPPTCDGLLRSYSTSVGANPTEQTTIYNVSDSCAFYSGYVEYAVSVQVTTSSGSQVSSVVLSNDRAQP